MDYNRTSIRSVGGFPSIGTPPATARAVATSAITLSGTQTIDSVPLTIGDTCLVTAQTTASDNGLYTVASSAWTRTGDLIKSGMTVSIREGGSGFSLWCLTTPAPIGVGPIGIDNGTNQTWVKLSTQQPDISLDYADAIYPSTSVYPSGFPTIASLVTDGITVSNGMRVLIGGPQLSGPNYSGVWESNGSVFIFVSNPGYCMVNSGTLYAGSIWVDSGLGTQYLRCFQTSGASGALLIANNLSEITATASTARTNLGLGTVATHAATDFDAAGTAATAQTNAYAYTDAETTRATTAEGLKLAKASNLSDLASASTARTNLGLGTAATHAATDFLLAANNLSDVTASTARANLGLGTAATKNTGTAAGNVVVLDGSAKLPVVDGSQLTNLPSPSGVLLASNNLSDVSSASTSRTNLGLGTAATHPSSDFDASGSAALVLGVAALKANNLSDLASASSARTNLGLGTAATKDVGTGANNVVQLDGSAKMPVVDGSALTNLKLPYQSATGSGSATSSGNWKDGASITLTAGDWDISAVIECNPQASAMYMQFGISPTSGNSNSGLTPGDAQITISFGLYGAARSNQKAGGSIPNLRVQPVISTTYYLKIMFYYDSTTPTYDCRLSARKMG